MKQSIITFLFFIVCNFSTYSQNTDLNIFTITNSKEQREISTCDYGKSYYNQTCINSNGITIDFKGPYFTPPVVKISRENNDPFRIGSSVYADFVHGTVSPIINNAIDHTKRYSLSINDSQTETFSINNSTHSPMLIYLPHLNAKPEFPTLDGTVYRHAFDYWLFDTTFTMNPDITNSILLAPGWYDIEILGVRVTNILVFKDCQTRIKAGILKINSGSPWALYSNSGNNKLYSSTQSKMVEFPTGTYQLEINGATQQIQIKDGETLQIGDNSQAPQTQKLNTGTQPWEIKMDPTVKGAGGEISMQIPKGLGGRTHMEFFESGDYKNRVASWFDNNKEKLLPGLYNVVIDGRDTIKNVPVELGKQTRLKMGVFSVSGYRGQTIENSNNHQKFSYSAPFKILLPEGTYYLNGNKKLPIVIKDGELTEL